MTFGEGNGEAQRARPGLSVASPAASATASRGTAGRIYNCPIDMLTIGVCRLTAYRLVQGRH
jgi:hypothetical protein